MWYVVTLGGLVWNAKIQNKFKFVEIGAAGTFSVKSNRNDIILPSHSVEMWTKWSQILSDWNTNLILKSEHCFHWEHFFSFYKKYICKIKLHQFEIRYIQTKKQALVSSLFLFHFYIYWLRIIQKVKRSKLLKVILYVR